MRQRRTSVTMSFGKAVRPPMIMLAPILLAAWPGSAQADWAFTKWDMTPEQVVAASKGTAHTALPRKTGSGDKWILVEGTFFLAGDAYGARYSFRDKRLVAVALRPDDPGRCEDILRELRQKHGSAKRHYLDVKHWPAITARDDLSVVDLTAVSTAGFCVITYWKHGEMPSLPPEPGG